MKYLLQLILKKKKKFIKLALSVTQIPNEISQQINSQNYAMQIKNTYLYKNKAIYLVILIIKQQTN